MWLLGSIGKVMGKGRILIWGAENDPGMNGCWLGALSEHPSRSFGRSITVDLSLLGYRDVPWLVCELSHTEII